MGKLRRDIVYANPAKKQNSALAGGPKQVRQSSRPTDPGTSMRHFLGAANAKRKPLQWQTSDTP